MMNWSRNGIVWGVVVVALCLGCVSVSEGKTVLLEESFERCTVGQAPANWRKYVYGGADLQVVDDIFYPGVHDPTKGKSVKLSDPAAGAAYISKNLSSPPPKKMNVIFTVHMRADQADGQAYPIIVQGYAVRVGFERNGKFFYSTAGEKREKHVYLGAYKPYQWYEFKVVADVEAQSYDFYIDKKKQAAGIPFTKKIDRISAFQIGSGGAGKGTYYVDDVKVEIEKKTALSGKATKKEAKGQGSRKVGKIGTAVVNSFGEVISYGQVKSRVRNYFPIGVRASPGQFYPPVPWTWVQDHPQAQGSLCAVGFHSHPEVTYALSLKGEYEIWLSLRKKRRIVCGIGAKLSGEEKFAQIKLGKNDIPPKTPFHLQFFWKKWKTADLTGKEMIFNHPLGFETVLNSIKFVPVGANEGDNRKTVVLRNFVAQLRPRDRIYEYRNLEHIANNLEPIFAYLKQLNLNMLVVRTNDSPTAVPIQQEAVLKKAHQHGLKVVMSVPYFYHTLRGKKKITEAEAEKVFGKFVAAVKDYPSLAGYLISDEPHVEEAEKLAVIHRVLKRLDPEHPAMSYYCRRGEGFSGLLGGKIPGKDNMKLLCERTETEVLFSDIYPIRHAESEFLANFDPFIRCLDDTYRQAGGRPWWMLVQAFHYSSTLRDPTAAEMRAQTYLSIAHGATGIVYYYYNGPHSSLLTEEGKPNAACEEVGKLAAELQILAPILLKLKRLKLNAARPKHVDLQGFVDDENKRYIMAVNKDVTATRKVKVRLPADGIKQIVNVLTGKSVPFQKAAGRIRLDLALAPGDGILLKLN